MYVGPTLPSLQTYLIQLGKKKRETMQSTGARLFNAFDWPLIGIDWRRVSSVVEHSSTNPKVPGHTGVMDYDEACFMHLTHGVFHNFPKAVGV